MRSFFVSSIIFLFFFAGTVYGEWSQTYGINTRVGCYDWKGRIRCEDGSPISRTATVGIWEEDNYFDKDDFIDYAKVALNGTYSFRACIDDNVGGIGMQEAQPFLEFAKACPGVDWSYTYETTPFEYLTYEIAKEGRRANVIARSEI